MLQKITIGHPGGIISGLVLPISVIYTDGADILCDDAGNKDFYFILFYLFHIPLM
jgi:hypothetical protein